MKFLCVHGVIIQFLDWPRDDIFVLLLAQVSITSCRVEWSSLRSHFQLVIRLWHMRLLNGGLLFICDFKVPRGWQTWKNGIKYCWNNENVDISIWGAGSWKSRSLCCIQKWLLFKMLNAGDICWESKHTEMWIKWRNLSSETESSLSV